MRVNSLCESSTSRLVPTNGSTTTLSGLFAVVDELNNNGRIYPDAIYSEAVKEILPKIHNRSLLGETDHPLDRDEVFLSNVSHVITDCHPGRSKSGKKAYYGTVELLDTPAGKIVQALVKANIPIGISSRGIGNTRQTSEGTEVTKFKLITYDLVAEPSFSSAVLSEDAKTELTKDLNSIESKLPMNESSSEGDSLRESINSIRKSLKLTERRVNNTDSKLVQTIELATLKSLVKSKTKKLEESKKDIERYKTLNKDLNSRYTSIRNNHQRLQDSYNELKEKHEKEMREMLSLKESKILELQKRLAVEKRGMSYSNVSGFLNDVNSVGDIDSRLDSIASMNKKSISITEGTMKSVQESLIEGRSSNKLSKLIARV